METKDILKKLRKDRKCSAKDVAIGCDMSIGVYQKYESGERGVGTPALCKIADFYSVSTDYLLGRTTVKQMAIEQLEPLASVDISDIEKRIILKYTELDENMRAVCMEVFRQLSEVNVQCEDKEE